MPEALCESVKDLIDALVVSNLLFISFDECVLNADGSHGVVSDEVNGRATPLFLIGETVGIDRSAISSLGQFLSGIDTDPFVVG